MISDSLIGRLSVSRCRTHAARPSARAHGGATFYEPAELADQESATRHELFATFRSGDRLRGVLARAEDAGLDRRIELCGEPCHDLVTIEWLEDDIVAAHYITQLANFLTKSPRVPLADFPGLFAMQGHTGACGAVFTFLWFGLASIFFPNLWTNGGPELIVSAVFVGSVFFGLLWVCFSLPIRLGEQIKELDLNTIEGKDLYKKLERRVRIWMALFSGNYVIACCVLIWMTGGATSPFVPFYIMIFTLTIAKNRVMSPGIGIWVLTYFLVLIVVSCLVAKLLPTVIDKVDMDSINRSGFQIAMHILFICFSLIVPTLSTYFVERREMKVLKPQQIAVNP